MLKVIIPSQTAFQKFLKKDKLLSFYYCYAPLVIACLWQINFDPYFILIIEFVGKLPALIRFSISNQLLRIPLQVTELTQKQKSF